MVQNEDLLVGLAIALLISVTIVFVIDLVTELMSDDRWLRYKWSLLWYAARYLGIISAVLLALDVLFGGVTVHSS